MMRGAKTSAAALVAAVLLDPRVIPILEERLAMMKAEAKSAVDLDAVEARDLRRTFDRPAQDDVRGRDRRRRVRGQRGIAVLIAR